MVIFCSVLIRSKLIIRIFPTYTGVGIGAQGACALPLVNDSGKVPPLVAFIKSFEDGKIDRKIQGSSDFIKSKFHYFMEEHSPGHPT